MKRGSGSCAVDIYCTAALTSLSDSVSYIIFLFSEWRIKSHKKRTHSNREELMDSEIQIYG